MVFKNVWEPCKCFFKKNFKKIITTELHLHITACTFVFYV